MASFYRTQKIVNEEIDRVMKEHLESKKPINLYNWILSLTVRFEIGERQVSKRIDLWLRANPDNIFLSEGVLSFE